MQGCEGLEGGFVFEFLEDFGDGYEVCCEVVEGGAFDEGGGVEDEVGFLWGWWWWGGG